MGRKSPAEDDYTSCAAELIPASDGTVYVFTVTYTSPSADFSQLKKAIGRAKAASTVPGISSDVSELSPKDGMYRLKVTFTKHDGQSQQNFLASEIKGFTYNLGSEGALNKDEAAPFVRNFCEGNGPVSMFAPTPAPAPTPIAGTPAPAPPSAPPPSSQIFGPAVATAAITHAAPAPGVPLLRYQSLNAQIGTNGLTRKCTLKLIYSLSGTAASVAADHAALSAGIGQAMQTLPRQGAVYTSHSFGNNAPNISIAASGAATSSLEVEFARMYASSSQNIQEQDMRDVVDALGRKGCVSSTEHTMLHATIGCEVNKPGFNPTP